MRCPNCQKDNYPGARFCIGCGTRLPQPPSRGRLAMIALLKAAAYYGLFFFVQTAVMFFYEVAVMMPEAMRIGLSGGIDEALLTELSDLLMDALSRNIHILLILSGALTLLILFFFYHSRGKNPLEEMHLTGTPVSPLLSALLLGIAAQFFVSITLTFLPIPESVIESFNNTRSTELIYGNGPLWLELISIAVVTPILEEVIFRGLIFTRLRRAMSVSLALGLCALIFGVVHGHYIAIIYASLLGILLCLLMLRVRDSVLAPICCHMGFNFGSYLINWIFGDTVNMPLMLAFYFLSIALCLICAYMIFRRADQEAEEEV